MTLSHLAWYWPLAGGAMIGTAAGAYLVLEQQTHLFGIRICDRPFSLGSLFLFYGLLAGVGGPARKLSSIFFAIQIGAAAADRVFP